MDRTDTSSAVLVELYLGETESYLFAFSPEWGEVRGHRSDLTLSDARRISESIKIWLTQGRGTGREIGLDTEDHARLAEFLRPILTWTRPDQPLVIVPHDVLHTIPLHALALTDGLRLVERNAVSYAPSAGVLRYCRSWPRRTTGRMVAVTDSDPRRPLPFARAHGAMLTRQHANAVHLSGRDAVLPEIDAELAGGDAEVFHAAVHGVYRPDTPMQSGLALADGTLTAERIMKTRLDGAIVTLCACESGAAVPLDGDELLGITRACLHAGARGVVVGQWSIDDLSTGLLMEYFYGFRSSGIGTAASMRAAQLALRRTSAERALEFSARALAEIDADPVLRKEALFGQAEIHLRATNPLGAETTLAPLRSAPLDQADERRLRGALVRAALLRRTGAEPNLRLQLFDEPYFWASYAVVGDWS